MSEYTAPEHAGLVYEVCAVFTEPAASAVVDFTAGGGGALGIDIISTPGSAARPADYHVNLGRIYFNNTNQRACALMNIIDDGMVEPDETFTLRMQPLEPASAPPLSYHTPTATVTITDNDSPGVRVYPTALSVAEGEGGGALYAVRLNTDPGAGRA